MVQWLDRDLPLKLKITEEEWASLPSPEKFASLSDTERRAIFEQASLCRKYFEYAARNYFWIVNNESKDQLFSLWESQYLVLETMRQIKAKGKKQLIFIIKARRLGMSALIEALIAWQAIFFRNRYAIVLSVDEEDSAYLFGMMEHIYNKLPWWLKPEVASREIKGGLVFDRKDPALRGIRPGNNSHVRVEYSTQWSGVGQGKRVSAAHISELSDFDQQRAEEIIMEDLTPAIHDTPVNFGFIETTGKGTGNTTHRLWRASEKLADRAAWYPLFLGWFFEHSRTMVVMPGWKPQRQEAGMRDRIQKEWVRCSNSICGQYRSAGHKGESLAGAKCIMCGIGTMMPVILTNGQLVWHEDRRIQAEANSREALKKFKQEYAATAEDAFQVSGYSVFDDLCYENVDATLEDEEKVPYVRRGFIGNPDGRFHGCQITRDAAGEESYHCYLSDCTDDHRFMSPMDSPFIQWRDPVPGAEYSIGVDVAEGIGQDYSVIFVNRIGGVHAPDEQVAVWRDNNTDPKTLAFYADKIGRMYNEAVMCVEYNVYNTTGDDILYAYNYPNIYRWKHKDSTNPQSNKWHWWTKAGHKTVLYQNARYWLRGGVWIIRSKNFREEMTTFVKEEFDDRSAAASATFHDDELMAGCIALYCSHEFDIDPGTGKISLPSVQDANTPKEWIQSCDSCLAEWPAATPEEYVNCPATHPDTGEPCGSVRLRARRKNPQADPRKLSGDDVFKQMGQRDPNAAEAIPVTWDQL